MSPDFEYGGTEGMNDEDGRRQIAVDYSRFRYTNPSRRKLRTKKKTPPAGMHKRHNKRWAW